MDFKFEKISEKFFILNKAPRQLSESKSKESKNNAILNYGDNNLFPNELSRAIASSPIASSCANTLYKYVLGKEILLKENYQTEFSKKIILLAKKIIPKIAHDLCLFWGFTPQYIFDLNGFLSEINYVPFQSVRLGKYNSDFEIEYAKICKDWSQLDKFKKSIYKIDLFKEESFKEILNIKIESGIDEFKSWNGFLDYQTIESIASDEYPEPSHSSAIKWIYTDGQIQNFHSNNVDNAFMPSTIFYVPFQLDGFDENGISNREALKNKIKSLSGVANGGETVVVEGHADVAPQIIPFNSNNNHEMFITLANLIRDNICSAFQMPPILAGIQVAGKLGGSAREMHESSEWYYNNIAISYVKKIEDWFNNIIKYFEGYNGEEIFIEKNRSEFIDSNLISYYSTEEVRSLLKLKEKELDERSIILNTLNGLSPLLANKLIDNLTKEEIRKIIGIDKTIDNNKDAML